MTGAHPPGAVACALLLAGLLVAGCGDPAPTSVEVSGRVIELEEPLDKGNGIVAGIVGNDAIYPLEGVRLHLVGTDLGTTSDSGGQFAIVDVPPGIYILEGSKKDHATVQTTVDVQPGGVAKAVLLLPRIPPTDPFHLTFEHQGQLELSANGVSVGMDNTSFDFTLEPSAVRTVVVESKWTGTFVASGQRPPLVYRIETLGYRTVSEDEVPNPFVLHLDGRILNSGHTTFKAVIRPNQPDPYLTYQGRSQDFVTVFYNEAAPPSWSIVQGSV